MVRMNILKKVLEGVKPNKKEAKEITDKINVFLKKVNSGLKNAKAVLGGSGAKNTWLKDAHDADVFVQFDYNKFKDKSFKLSDILEKHLKKKFKISRLHGSRDYFQIKEKNFTFEIVPVLKISKAEQAMNITDVSLLHAKWVVKYKKYADDIRLTKKFCKANSIYGAESYINGFSGYICEILTVKYKGFLGLVRAAAKWNKKTVVDIEKYYKNKNDVLFTINKSKQQGPLILIDPVQKDRNAAAALSYEKYNHFIDSCKKFLKKKNISFFIEKKIDILELKKKAKKNKLIVLEVEPLKGKQDVIGSKLLKVVNFLFKKLEKNDFKIKNYGWDWNKEKKCLIWFIVDPKKLSLDIIKQGPPVDIENHAKIFKKRYKNARVLKGSLVAKVKRKFREALPLVKKLIKDNYIKEKVKSINL